MKNANVDSFIILNEIDYYMMRLDEGFKKASTKILITTLVEISNYNIRTYKEPKEGIIYFRHPSLDNIFLPQSHKLEDLVVEYIQNLSTLMQKIGAKEMSITDNETLKLFIKAKSKGSFGGKENFTKSEGTITATTDIDGEFDNISKRKKFLFLMDRRIQILKTL